MRLHGWKHDVIALGICVAGTFASFAVVQALGLRPMWVVPCGIPVGIAVGVYLGIVDLREARTKLK